MNKTAIIRKYIAENDYYTYPTRRIAKMVIIHYPDVFGELNEKNVENVRTLVRDIRYSHGEARKSSPNSIFAQKFHGFLEPENFNYTPFVIPGSVKKLGIIADVHLPFFHEKNYRAAINWLVEHECDALLINGDFMDCYNISYFIKDRRMRRIVEEFKMAREMLDELSSLFGRIYYKLGNHEERMESYVFSQIPELIEFLNFEDCLKDRGMFNLSEYRIELIQDKRPIKFTDNLTIIHGHEYGRSFANPVGAARWLYLKAGANSMCSHLHASTEYSDRMINDKMVTCWSVGCLCDLHPKYRPLNKWQGGFARVSRLDKHFKVTNLRVEDGEVY